MSDGREKTDKETLNQLELKESELLIAFPRRREILNTGKPYPQNVEYETVSVRVSIAPELDNPKPYYIDKDDSDRKWGRSPRCRFVRGGSGMGRNSSITLLRDEVLSHVFQKVVRDCLEAMSVAQDAETTLEGFLELGLMEAEAQAVWQDVQARVEAAKDNPILKRFGVDIIDPEKLPVGFESEDPNNFAEQMGWGVKPT